jgi:hypothetical protein
MSVMSTSSEAFQRELRQAREQRRGDMLRITATFACEEEKCATEVVRISVVEQFGVHRPFQWPLKCPRCMAPFERYIGLSIER